MKYFRIFLLNAQDTIQQRTRSFIWFLIAFLNPFILLMFWGGALEGGKIIGGWDSTSMQTYYLLAIICQSVLIHHVEITVADEDIRRGGLVRELLKPVSYIWLKLCHESPWRFVQGFFGFVVLMLFLAAGFSFNISHAPSILLQALIISTLAFFLTFLFKLTVGLLAFWMTDIYGIIEPNEVLILTFSGVFMPFDLMPVWIQQAGQYTPYPYIVYYPVVAFMGRDGINFYQIMFIQLLWILGFYALYRVLWSGGVKKFSGVGQ